MFRTLARTLAGRLSQAAKHAKNVGEGVKHGWKGTLHRPDTTALVPFGAKIIPTRAYNFGAKARAAADFLQRNSVQDVLTAWKSSQL